MSVKLETKVRELLAVFLESRQDLFLVDLKFSSANDIVVILDGDNGVSLQDCLDASRSIENNLDREEEDFSLQVMSAGLSEPLSSVRQYRKNIGRKLEVLLIDDQEVEGELLAVEEEHITLKLKYRKKKDIGKGKMTVVEERAIAYSDIKKAKVKISFK
ncbi:MAG: ribosome assembly cofactor RimP [Flavobacteriales bacterium]|nr:MAG: ribosome assembly cofactor RimP [Flavobacteriales bacterium]